MNPKIESLLNEAEDRYLKSDELASLGHYVVSMPDRLDVYRSLRDREVEIMQPVADQLQTRYPNDPDVLERSIKNGLLILRYCSMAMLLDDVEFVNERIRDWLDQVVQAYESQAIEQFLYQLLEQQIQTVLGVKAQTLLHPYLEAVQAYLKQLPQSSAS